MVCVAGGGAGMCNTPDQSSSNLPRSIKIIHSQSEMLCPRINPPEIFPYKNSCTEIFVAVLTKVGEKNLKPIS